MIQPGVYFALDAPFVRIIGLYSNVLEDPGVISSENKKYPRVSDEQIAFLTNQLTLTKNNFKGAVVAPRCTIPRRWWDATDVVRRC